MKASWLVTGAAATEGGCNQKHEIQGNDMNKGINGCCQKKACCWTQALTERSLHKTMPVNLLSRPHDQEEKKSDRREAELGLVEIDD